MKKFNCFLSKLLIVGLVSSSISSFAPPVLANETVVTTEETTSLPDESATSPEVSAPEEEAITVPPTETPITPPIPETEQEPLKQDVATPIITDAPTIADPQPEAAPEKKTIPLQLLGINDFHGALSTTGTAYIEGTAFSKAGKAALLATYLNNAQTNFQSKKPDGTTIRVQSGDMVGASPANSGLLQDEPTIKVLNKMNFEIGTLGNHEFDEGLGEFNRIMTGQAPLPGEFNQITEDYTHEASTQDIVIANMTDKNGNIPYGWEPYTIKTVKDGDKEVKVGFIGIVTTEIPNLVLKQHYQDYNFLDEAETIAKYDKILQDQGVNAIVVLAHVPAVSTNQVVSGEAADIMDKVNTASPDNSVDAFFAGHNHQYTNGVVGKTRIVQSTSQGKAFINLKAELDPETNDFVAVPDAEVTPVQAGVTEDPEVKAIIDDADTRVTKVTSEKIGTATTNQTISREVEKDSPNKESAVGNLVTDGQRVMAQKQGFNVDFAMTNNGGIRADLLVQEDRSITWGAAQNVQPFGNILQVVHMTGQQIENVLNEQYDEEGKYFLQLSGLTYQYTDTSDANQPYKVHQIRKTNGELLDPNASYLVVVNDFLFGGGDGFKTFTEATFEATMTQDTDTFIDYIKAQEADGKTIEAQIEGRKSYISPEQIKAEEEAAAIASIKAATVLPDIKEGITTFTGKTIPNGTVTAQLKNSKARAILSTTANANGDFTLDLQSLNLAKDLVVTFVVTDANGYSVAFDKTVLAKEENGEAAAIAAIKAATVLPDIKEGITTFTGKTIPNGTVTAQLKNSKARAILSTTANANGDFTLDLQSLNLAKDLVVTFVVTDANGYSVAFDKTVLAKDAVTNGNGTTTGNGNNGTPTGTTNNPLSPPTVAASFPQTGEKESSVSTLAGLILLGSAAFYLTKKNKHKSIA